MSENDVRIDIRGNAESFKRAAQEAALALNKLEDAGDKVSESTARQRAQAEKYLLELQKEAALLGQGEAVRRKLEVSMMDMTDAQRKQAMAVIDNVEAYKQAIAAQERMAATVTRLATVVGTVLVAALAMAGRAMLQATMEQEQASARLDAVLRATGHAAGLTRRDLDDLAESMKNRTLFDDDQVRNAMSILLTFKNVQGDVFKDTIEVAGNLASVMRMDLSSATMMLGKALENPEHGLTALQRAGVSFSDSQREVIAEMMASGHQAEGLTLILKALKEQGLDHVSEAMRTGLTGATKQLSDEWDDLLKAFGQTAVVKVGVVGALNGIAEALKGLRDLVEGGSEGAPWWFKLNPGTGQVAMLWEQANKIREASRSPIENWNEEGWEDVARLEAQVAAEEGAHRQRARQELELFDKATKEYLETREKVAKEANDAAKSQAKHEADAILSLRERLMGTQHLSEAEKTAWEIEQGRYKDYSKATKDQLKDIAQQIDAEKAREQAAKDAKKVLEEEEKARKDLEKTREKALGAAEKESESIAKQLEQERDRVAAIGLSKEAIAELSAAKIDLIAVEKEEYATNLQNAAGEHEHRDLYLQIAAAVRQQAKDLRDLAALKRDGASRQVIADQVEEYDKQWTKTADDVSRGLTDALMRGFEGGKDAAENFRDGLVNMFKTLILRPIIQPIVQAGAGAVLNMLGLPGQGAGGMGGLSGGGNLLSAGSNVWNALGGANSITGSAGAGMYGAFATSDLGLSLGLSAAAPAGLMGPTAGGYALGAASEGGAVLTSLGSSIGAAIPWVAVALAVASMLMKPGGGPKVEGNAYGVVGDDGSFNSVTSGAPGTAPYGDGDWGRPGSQAAAVRGVLAPFGQSLSEFVKGLGGDATGVGLHLGFNTDPQGDAPDNIGASVYNAAGDQVYRHGYDVDRGQAPEAMSLEAQRVFVAAIKASDIDPIFRSIIDGVDLMTASADQLNQVLADLKTVDVMMDYGTEESDPFAVYAKSAEEASRTLMGTWAMQGDAIRGLIDTYDGSVASTMKLANATAARYQTEIQLAQQFAQVLESTGAMFENSIRTVKLDGLTNEEKYSFYDEEAARYKDLLASVSDPASIALYSEKLNNSIMSGWGLLSDEQKRATKDEYLALLGDADELSAKRIQAGQDQVREDRRELGEAIKTAIREAMAEAAEGIGNAVPSEIAVTVTVDGPATAEVGSMG